MMRFNIFLNCLVISSFFCGGKLYGQYNNLPFEEPNRLLYFNDSLPRLGVSANAILFFKNNEYFEERNPGYTLFGTVVSPTIFYKPTSNILVEGGTQLAYDYGLNAHRTIDPIFRAVVRRDSLMLVLGTLYGHAAHRLPEPIFDFEHSLNQRLEHGLQVFYRKKIFELETWIDWRSMIYTADTTQEEFLFGLSPKLYIMQNNWGRLSVVGVATAFHRGGQTNITTAPVYTVINTMVGLKLITHRRPENRIKQFTAEAYHLGFSSEEIKGLYSNPTGRAFFVNLGADSKIGYLGINYYLSDNYSSPIGGGLYDSYSRTPEFANAYTQLRKLLFIRYAYNWHIDNNLCLTLRFEPFFYFPSGKMDFSHGIYLNYKPSWATKIRNQYLFN